MLRWTTLLIIVVGLASPALAQKTAVAPAPSAAARQVEALPLDLAGFRRSGPVNDFEARPDGAGLGAAVDYRLPAGGGPFISTYIYDRRRGRMTDGLGRVVDEDLAIAAREIQAAAPSRGYSVRESHRLAEIAGPSGASALRCDRYELLFDAGSQASSFACIGIVRGQFLKLRITYPRRAQGSPADGIPYEFTAALLAAMAPAASAGGGQKSP